MPRSTPQTRPDYGLDAPRVIRTMLFFGAAGMIAGITVVYFGRAGSGASTGIGPSLQWMGAALLIGGLLMIASSRWGKLHARDRLLDRMALTGSETVLDVGCGHGLMLIGAATRVPHGRAIGVDLWSQVDQMSNSSVATMRNAQAAGVADRVEVLDGDMCALPLQDGTIDVVVSSLAIHNVSGRDARRKAIQEIVRVLKPGGRVGIIDIAHVGAYAADFRAAGMREISKRGFALWIYPPTRVLTAVK